jgi:mono/diheme cytochrome c family protein
VQQIWKPELGITDRCVTCHVAMGNALPVHGHPIFKAHPPIPHDPREYGCTVCHGGQGRATTREAAHGFVSFWDEQLLDKSHTAAGCGTCHNSIPLISRTELARGRRLVESLDCLACHRLEGQGRGKALDLSYVGIKGFKLEWHAWHLEQQVRDTTGTWKPSYGTIANADLKAIDEFMHSRIGAPRVVEAQALAFERGCLGCHKIGGRGGEEGPALDVVGRKPIGDLNFKGVLGERTLVNYLRRHFRDPAGVVAGSLMPAQAASDEDADLLTAYALFMRSRKVPPAYLPKDRARREILGEARTPLAGSQAFGAYCAGCHGLRGEGRNYGNLDVRFPAIGSADFLEVATDAYIESTLQHGRPGRRMPALGAAGGSLGADELKQVVSSLRSMEPKPASFAEVARTGVERVQGVAAYERDCAACHGRAGEGSELGSPLAADDGKVRGKREDLYRAIVNGVPDTAMPRYRGYDAATLASLMDFVAAMPGSSRSRAGWQLGKGDDVRGKELYSRRCAGCHGANGEGKLGPALGNPAFLQAATSHYIAATIERGRAGTPMPAFGRDNVSYPRLSAAEVLDVTEYIRNGLEPARAAR